jgi:hypothetical protein
MTQVVALEFCADFFKTEEDCYTWLRNSDYADLLRVKGFSLRRNANAKILTTERKRAVWKWNQGLGTFTGLMLQRPVSVVVLVLAAGPKFSQMEMPALLQSTVLHEKNKMEKHKARVEALRIKRAEEAKLKPPKPAKKRGGGKKRKTAASFLEATYGKQVGSESDEQLAKAAETLQAIGGLSKKT